ncbi:MAG: pyrroline-5-carboxylate reductase [Eubacterium sp.]|nr:pyrroline-5-carboxylate reductase [Eubacterium sp.]MDD7209149.1 pyrroline-5-carboxylate reductase [Lachnospiraceae bacterium]MDY5498325.1 pyrroline-5-carboxylate reductase [Anaerobutyricum sp.]
MKTLGFIGMGNMAGAIASGIIEKGLMEGGKVFAYAPHSEKLLKNAKKIGFTPCNTLKELVSRTDTIVMACKPYQIEKVLEEIGKDLKGKALLSVAAGWNFEKYKPHLEKSTRFQFIMPNTPAMVGEGVLLFEEENSLFPEERKEIMKMFEALGVVMELPASLMGIGGALTGCGPAFIDLIIEALGDVGVKYGIARNQAYAMVSQMIKGSATLQLETGDHPGVLKDNVCSPAGTTIRGVDALEHAGVRAAFIDAVDAIMNK